MDFCHQNLGLNLKKRPVSLQNAIGQGVFNENPTWRPKRVAGGVVFGRGTFQKNAHLLHASARAVLLIGPA